MKILLNILFIFFTLACSSTSQQFSEDSRIMQKIITPHIGIAKFKQLKAVILMPGSGCHGCIRESEMVVQKNYKRTKNCLFVFTRIGEVKRLKARLAIDIHHPNIFIDKESQFEGLLGNKPIYPLLFVLKEGIIQEKMELSSNTNLASFLSETGI